MKTGLLRPDDRSRSNATMAANAYRGSALHLQHFHDICLVRPSEAPFLVIGAGDSPHGVTNDYSLVQNNIIYNSARTAIAESGKTGQHNKYIDNLIYCGNIDISLNNGLRAMGTVNADPKFVNNTGTAAGNYQLLGNSPAYWAKLALVQ